MSVKHNSLWYFPIEKGMKKKALVRSQALAQIQMQSSVRIRMSADLSSQRFAQH